MSLMKHLTTFSHVGLGQEFPRKLNTSGPLGQKFHCQFLESLGNFLRDTFKTQCVSNQSGWLLTTVSGMSSIDCGIID